MTHNIEIKIECKGSAVGTIGWFNSIMEKSEFVIKNNKSGVPAIFLRTMNADGTDKHRFLCRKADSTTYPDYNITDDGYACEIAEGDGYNAYGFVNHPITPACRKAVEDMIDKAKDVFAEWWENDGK